MTNTTKEEPKAPPPIITPAGVYCRMFWYLSVELHNNEPFGFNDIQKADTDWWVGWPLFGQEDGDLEDPEPWRDSTYKWMKRAGV